MSVRSLHFGCRLNAEESGRMQALAEAGGAGPMLVVNTCAVTAEAEAQARQAIRRAARSEPGLPIHVTGCAATIAPAAWAALPGVVRVVPNNDKLRPESWSAAAPPAPRPVAGQTRALLPIQTGCDHHCTFCIIPQGRGASRSVPLGEAAARLRALVESGVQEVVLTGVDIASYGTDLPGTPRLGQAVRRLLALVPELPRLRLSSLDPAGIDDDLWRLLAEEPRLMPHLHLSVQHGATLILKRMKRRHGRAEVVALARRARALRPEIAFGADLIAGFPTESEAHFMEMLALVEEAGLSFLHVFPFSARPSTPAARMPQLPVPLRRERAARLRAAGQAAAQRLFASRLGRVERVLLERGGRGHTEQFAPVRLAGGTPPAGSLLSLRVLGADDSGLIVEAA
ncbi:MiaB/RimO family radical SAM methylthiotransferase [Falsiroseomonas selenitidurans]|uniref:MiaB/RimO family radical SAM methylthiotransferase n=1 Tax=Falsiroseomonas selenitidurans TaxID=2716335 RepID=A0ABX1DXM3_9PROT|nr:MiaB/RimO family radical SAM methylthiotransferase [Falsiroseomonas selenitidurans]NKC29659.1 MiaB/RimO family radical SAM methylthiotransferase [Falsiroseomonas selenitidurans]